MGNFHGFFIPHEKAFMGFSYPMKNPCRKFSLDFHRFSLFSWEIHVYFMATLASSEGPYLC